MKIIKGKEFKDNFGGWSRYACPSCRERLSVHISHKRVKIKRRYFCSWCGNKYELKESEPTFVELFHGELPNQSFFRDSPNFVID